MKWFTWPRAAISNIERDVARHTGLLEKINRKLDIMSENEAAALAKLEADLNTVVAGWAAKDAQIAALQADLATVQAALASADADKAAAVADALTADDAADTVAIDAADAIVANLVNPPVEPPPAA